MKRSLSSFVFVGALAATGLAAPALAGPSYDNRDLKGEFLFTIVELRRDTLPGAPLPANLNCVSSGTAAFDGAGTMIASGTQRCQPTPMPGQPPLPPQPPQPLPERPLYYAVNADGSFLMSETPDFADPFHGEIVDHGRSLLLDGTTRPVSNTVPSILSWSGVMMKR